PIRGPDSTPIVDRLSVSEGAEQRESTRETPLQLGLKRMIRRMARRGHGLKASEFWKWPRIVGVRQIARLRIVVAHQPAKPDSSGSKVIHLERRIAGQLSLNA